MRCSRPAGLIVAPAAAHADWNGDGPGDVLTVHPDGRLLLYRGNGAGGWVTGTAREPSAAAGPAFTALLAPGDFSGDGKPDLLVRDGDGQLLMYRGNGTGGWAAGDRRASAAAGDRSPRCSRPATSAATASRRARPQHRRRAPHVPRRRRRRLADRQGREDRLRLGPFKAILAAATSAATASPTCSRSTRDGALLLYRGNGAGGWVTGKAEPVGSGWAGFTALATGGDFNGDGKADVLARTPDGSAAALPRQRRERLGHRQRRADRQRLERAHLPDARAGLTRRRPPRRRPRRAAPPAAPVPDGNVTLTAGIRCTPPGGLLRVSVKVRKRAGGRRRGSSDRVLRPQRPAPDRPPAAVHGAAADAPPRRAGGPRLRARLLPPRGHEEAAHQDGVAALRHVQLGAQVGQNREHAAVRSPAWRSGRAWRRSR